ncbi:unnamed protein product [Bursaphelenchus okinawaensis]|uniref:Arginase n=1 Tax=Bursaphelenchus okinawaensis TaxID=465554 RepID=A0A811LPD7_9BILA|nr:unnamed protein product [Bursaphelenchus okinawaensis]CAG9126870.1 unnamed protein product [Bursaphelenchus okinawaensis]
MRLTVCRLAGRYVNAIGLANGHGGRHLGCENNLNVLTQSDFMNNSRVGLKWHSLIEESVTGRQDQALHGVVQNSRNLCSAVSTVLREDDQNELLVIGGDHSCAIGTWSGVASTFRPYGDIGLIWVDAHMDAHTIESSPTKNIHGTPVAHLLGFGNELLRTVGDIYPKIKPQNLCLVGIRSFESEEQELLNRLGIRVFYDSEVQRRGIDECMNEAVELVSRDTHGFGMSIDLDGFRIKDAPAVGTPEPGGIVASEFLDYLRDNQLNGLLATEIVEFMPHKDDLWKRSERLVTDLIEAVYLPKVSAQLEEPVNEQRQSAA